MAQIAVDPFIPGLARDAVQVAKLADVEGFPQIIGNELGSLVHRRRLTPGHRAPPSLVPVSVIQLLPMSLD